MYYRYAADAVLLLHIAFIAFAVFGGLLAIWWHGILFIHLPSCGMGRLRRTHWLSLLINQPGEHSSYQRGK